MVETIITAAITAIVVRVIEIMFNNLPKIKKTIKLAIQQHKKKAMMEKGTVFFGGLPIFTSPNGYLYTISDEQKSIYCADCYKPEHNLEHKLVHLKKTGRKLYVCPVCNKEYKAK